MKRRAFTLVELMVVIAIVALLAAILVPSMSRVHALARTRVCQANLRRLSDAFATFTSARALLDAQTASRHVFTAYPRPMSWPSIPGSVVDDPLLYKCPDDEVGRDIRTLLTSVEYVNPYGRFPLDTMEGSNLFYKSRRGSDDQGEYTEYLFQDDYGNGQFELMDFHGWFDTDGFARIYDSGRVLVFDRVPDTPDFSGATGPGYPDRVNTCGDVNAIYYRGEPAFGNEGQMRNFRGQTIKLPDWNEGLTNYGINSYAYQYPYGTDCIVLVDYKEQVVEIDTPLESEKLLLESARHLSKVNYLRADGSVKAASPLDVSPRLKLSLWRPEK